MTAFLGDSTPSGVENLSARTSVGRHEVAKLIGSLGLLVTTSVGIAAPQRAIEPLGVSGVSVRPDSHGPNTPRVVDGVALKEHVSKSSYAPAGSLTQKPPSAAQLIQSLHAASGLTWDQLAKLFGVSRRSVHLWGAGGRMNGSNLERASFLLRTVQELPGYDAETKRTAIFAPGSDGYSRFDRLVSEVARGGGAAINRPPLPPGTLAATSG